MLSTPFNDEMLEDVTVQERLMADLVVLKDPGGVRRGCGSRTSEVVATQMESVLVLIYEKSLSLHQSGEHLYLGLFSGQKKKPSEDRRLHYWAYLGIQKEYTTISFVQWETGRARMHTR